MRFFEHEAREIVRRAGIPVTDFGFTTDAAQARTIAERIGGPTVVKSQVLTGGRMKAGGVQFADTPEQAERHAADILELGERVDLGEHHVVLAEQPREPPDDRHQPGQRLPGQAHRRDHLLGLVVRERSQRGEVRAAHPVRVARGDLLDVDPAHVGEDQDRALARRVPRDPGVELPCDRDPRVDQHATRLVAADLKREDRLGVRLGLLGRVGELHAAGLHAAAGQHL